MKAERKVSSIKIPQLNLLSQVVSSDGCLLACAINAACAVLMDAGIPLHHPFGKAPVLSATPCTCALHMAWHLTQAACCCSGGGLCSEW